MRTEAQEQLEAQNGQLAAQNAKLQQALPKPGCSHSGRTCMYISLLVARRSLGVLTETRLQEVVGLRALLAGPVVRPTDSGRWNGSLAAVPEGALSGVAAARLPISPLAC